LETKGKRVTEEPSQELWHSFNLNEVVVVDIEVVPGLVEVLSHVSGALSIVEVHVGVDNLVRNFIGCIFVQEEVAGWSSTVVLHFQSVSLDQGVHKSIVSFFDEILWDLSSVSTSGLGFTELWNKMLKLLSLGLEVHVVTLVKESPVVVEMA
jgi:hypothetical protein